MLRTAQLLPLEGHSTLGFDPARFPTTAASLLPGLLTATRTGLTPASDDELTTRDHLHQVTSSLLVARKMAGAISFGRLTQYLKNDTILLLMQLMRDVNCCPIARDDAMAESVHEHHPAGSAHYRLQHTGEIIREVASLRNVTLAVFHRNPYLHLAVTDESDGSNFDVMVTEPHSIDVYPGYLVSTSALSRLVDHISDRFGGDKVNDRVSRKFSLSELTVGR